MLKINNVKLFVKKLYKTVSDWFMEHEKQLVLIIGLMIIVILSFTFGILKGTGLSQTPITVMRPVNEPVIITEQCQNTINLTAKDCVYVGSTKGTKYYPPTCSYAKKISKENLRCFKSDEDAIEKGYTKSTSCK